MDTPVFDALVAEHAAARLRPIPTSPITRQQLADLFGFTPADIVSAPLHGHDAILNSGLAGAGALDNSARIRRILDAWTSHRPQEASPPVRTAPAMHHARAHPDGAVEQARGWFAPPPRQRDDAAVRADEPAPLGVFAGAVWVVDAGQPHDSVLLFGAGLPEVSAAPLLPDPAPRRRAALSVASVPLTSELDASDDETAPISTSYLADL